MRDQDKFLGCFYGGAIGDALGFEIEFMPEEDIFQRFGEKGITEYVLKNGVAEISDDTQMTLFTATGLLTGATDMARNNKKGKYESYIFHSYKDWFKTQTELYPLSDQPRYSWLANIPTFFSSRAPGRTCIAALAKTLPGTTRFPINRSKGCGGIMRVAPIGLFFCDTDVSIKDSDRLGAEAAALTHGHELGWLPAAALVHIIRFLAETENATILEAVMDSMKALPELYPKATELNNLLELMQKAIDLSEEDGDDLDAIHLLGRGNVAEETLAIAIYCSLKHADNFEQGIIAAVNHGGDSDSTGAVTGNILGTALGKKAIPSKWIDPLEIWTFIQILAEDLYRDGIVDVDGEYLDPAWEAKYITMQYPDGMDE